MDGITSVRCPWEFILDLWEGGRWQAYEIYRRHTRIGPEPPPDPWFINRPPPHTQDGHIDVYVS